MMQYALATILAALGCQPNLPAHAATPKPILKQADLVTQQTNTFGYQLFQQLPAGGNAMISPLSISLALRMAMNGASGDTLSQMNSALGLGGIDLSVVNASSASTQASLAGDADVQVSIANSIWTRQGFPFLQSFLDGVSSSYQAKISNINFNDPGAAKTINGWVNDSTNGKIQTIVPDPLPSDAVMYLINAVYFKGKWSSPFESNETSPEPFTLTDGTTVETPMMHKRQGGGLSLDGGREAISMPYKNGTYEMIAILPAANEAPSNVITALASKDLLASATPEPGLVALSFPKFHASFDSVLNDSLGKLGMTAAFTNGADFSKMRTEKDISISEVHHKTFIDVTEEGTEAAAVTSIGMRASAILANPRVLKFNRPFVYLLRQVQSGQVLFLGVLQNPKG